MRPRLPALTLGACLFVEAPPAAQSLAEVSRATEAARKATSGQPSPKVYTNKDLLPSDRPALAPPPATESATPAPAHVPDRVDTGTTPPAEVAPALRDEAYWRDRMRPVRERLARARALADDTKRQADALSRAADRCFPLGIVCVEYTDSLRKLEEHEALVAAVARAEREVFALEDEARRAGVPPGWLRN